MDVTALREMLASERLPWARTPIPGQFDDEALIEVRALIEALRRRGEAIEEEALDRLIAELGGRREALVDPWSLPRRLFDRLRGKGWTTNDTYAIPLEVLHGRGAR